MMFSDGIMVVFCIYFFSTHFSRVCLVYRQAAGLWWQDRLRPIVETVVNLTLNILLVRFFGVTGVMFSTIFCIVFIEGTWGASILFKHYFTEEKMASYLLKLLLSWGLTALSCAICYYICQKIALQGIAALIVNGIIASAVSLTIFAVGNSFLPEFRDALAFFLKLSGLKRLFAAKK